jgi:hypothetical protein
MTAVLAVAALLLVLLVIDAAARRRRTPLARHQDALDALDRIHDRQTKGHPQ